MNWRRVDNQENKELIYIECPRCKQWISIFKHSIDDNGNVTPSVVCPLTACGFHQYIKLRKFLRIIKTEKNEGQSSMKLF